MALGKIKTMNARTACAGLILGAVAIVGCGSSGGDNNEDADTPTVECPSECGPSPDTGGKQICRGDGRCSPEIFETVWDIPTDGYELTLPFYDDEGKGNCDFHILWGDEAKPDFATAEHVTDCTVESNRTHTYASKGEYHVKIRGVYDGWGGCTGPQLQNEQLQRVVSFGPVGLTKCAFVQVGNIELPTFDIPDAVK